MSIFIGTSLQDLLLQKLTRASALRRVLEPKDVEHEPEQDSITQLLESNQWLFFSNQVESSGLVHRADACYVSR